MKKLLPRLKRHLFRVKEFTSKHPKIVGVSAFFFVLLSIYIGAKSVETATKVVHISREGEFKGTRVFDGTEAAVYEAKERSLSKIASDLLNSQKRISEDVQKVTARLDALETKNSSVEVPASNKYKANPASSGDTQKRDAPPHYTGKPLPSEIIPGSSSAGFGGSSYGGNSSYGFTPDPARVAARGPDVITFPVASEDSKEEVGVVLPLGSYVKAKIIAGAKATTGEPAPVLLQLDYSYVGPNQKKIDLSGCFMTAKAQADLSIERVKMQLKDMSCVGRDGVVFEKAVSGFVNDDADNNFGISGPLESNQDRVARTAFLASIVEGVGKALQQAQTTQQTTPLGGDQSVMTGDQRKYLAGGAAANAGSMVAQWYLKQAENLLPTITAGSGRDVWIVMLGSVNLPNEYFNKGANDDRYSYVTRLLQ